MSQWTGECKFRYDTCIRYVNGSQSVIEICDMNALRATHNLIKHSHSHSHSHTINHIILSIKMGITVQFDGSTRYFLRAHVHVSEYLCVLLRLVTSFLMNFHPIKVKLEHWITHSHADTNPLLHSIFVIIQQSNWVRLLSKHEFGLCWNAHAYLHYFNFVILFQKYYCKFECCLAMQLDKMMTCIKLNFMQKL